MYRIQGTCKAWWESYNLTVFSFCCRKSPLSQLYHKLYKPQRYMYCDLCYTLKLFAVFSLWYLHSGFTVYLLICLKYLLHIMICFILPFFEMNLLGVHIIVEKKKLYAFLYKKPFRCTKLYYTKKSWKGFNFNV